MPRDVGDRQNIEHLVYDPFTNPPTLVDATVALTVTDPSGVTSTPSITHSATGTYRASFTLSAVGVWYWRWTVSGAVVDEAFGQVTAADPGAGVYATLPQLKAFRKLSTTDNDDDLTQALAAAARKIDSTTGDRQFWLDKIASARVFRPTGRTYCTADGEWLIIDDIGALAGLVVEVGDGTTWTAVTGYQTGPDNALAKQKPITRLLNPLNSWWTGNANQIRVTARWGWPAIPDVIVRATILQANRLFMRKDSPEGVFGNAEWGTARVSRVDPDVEALISDLCLTGQG